MHLRLLEQTYNVDRLQWELERHPELWDQVKLRTEHPQSPHRETSDIIVRYNPLENYQGNMCAWNDEHVAEWYGLVKHIPESQRLAEQIAVDYHASWIGMVLITRIPQGKQVYPHVDAGWHARHYEKFALQVKGDTQQVFCFDGEELRTKDGELFWFDNAYPHWVINDSDRERITMIVCLRKI